MQVKNGNPNLKIGTTYGGSGHSLKEAIRIKPDYADAHVNLGVAYNKLGQYQEAIPFLKEAIRIRPDLAEAHNNLGAAYHDLGQHQNSITSKKEAIRIKV